MCLGGVLGEDHEGTPAPSVHTQRAPLHLTKVCHISHKITQHFQITHLNTITSKLGTCWKTFLDVNLKQGTWSPSMSLQPEFPVDSLENVCGDILYHRTIAISLFVVLAWLY